jgi:hypothetical protein
MVNPRLWLNLGYDSTEIYSDIKYKEHLIATGIKTSSDEDVIVLLHKDGSKISMQCKHKIIKIRTERKLPI